MFRRPDNFNFEKPKRVLNNEILQDKLLEKVKKNNDFLRPKEIDFSDEYGVDVVQQDLDKIAEIEDRFSKKSLNPKQERLKNVSDILEALIVEQAEQSDWFGSETTFYPTSKYDDYINGIDGVVEFGSIDSEQRTGVSFDVVFASDRGRIISKLNRTKQRIKEGELTEVKYFEDEDGNRSQLKVPRIVLGTRLFSAESLIETWGRKSKDRMEKLKNHPMQIKLLLESYMQLKYFAEYAAEIGQAEVARIYADVCNIIVPIIQEKEDLYNSCIAEVMDDIVYETIHDYCGSDI